MTRYDTAFREVQFFRQDWLWALVVIGSIPAVVLAPAAVLTETGGLTDQAIRDLAIVFALVALGPLALWRFRLVTEVRSDGLYVKLFPLQWSFRHVPCSAIESADSVEFSAMGDYGGVGIRYGLSPSLSGITTTGPKAYVVDSGDGIRLERHDSRTLVVGTDRPEELLTALEQHCGRTTISP